MPLIEKGVAIPYEPPRVAWTPWFDALEIGDSLYVPGTEAAKARGAVHNWARRKRKSVTIKPDLTRGDTGGIRIWRTA